jgi:hypothetical protein
LLVAANGGHHEMVEMLLKAGANKNISCVRAKPLLVCMRARVYAPACLCICMLATVHACVHARVCASPLILWPSRALVCAQDGQTPLDCAKNYNRSNRERKERCIALLS